MKEQRTILCFSYIRFTLVFLLFGQFIFAQKTVNKKNPILPPTNKSYLNTHRVDNNFDFKKLISLNKTTGFTFSPSVQVNDDPGNVIDDYEPSIAVSDSGVIYVTWNGDENNKRILFSRSTDGGNTFSPAIKINDDVNYPPSYSVYQPDIALDSKGNIYVVWFDYRAWPNDTLQYFPIDIYLDRSTDGGQTWGTDVNVTGGNVGSGYYLWNFQPYIAINKKNDYIYVSFSNYDRYYALGDLGDVSVVCSKDNGQTFGPAVRVDDTNDTLLAVQSFSSITVDSSTGNVYVAFEDSRNTSKDIYLAKSTDDGQTFSQNVLVNTDTTNDQEEPDVKVDYSGNIYVIWKDWRADTSETQAPYLNNMYLAKSTDEGSSFLPDIKVSDEFLDAEYSYNFPPRLAIDKLNYVHAVWFDHRTGNANCFYDISTDGGQTFGTDVMVNDNVDTVSHVVPRIAVDDENNVYIVWMDNRNGNSKYDIFFSKKVNIVPVELSSFTASVKNNSVELNWTTVTETNNREFEIQRSIDKTNFTKIGSVKGHGTTTEKHNYSFVDENAYPGLNYYRIKQIDLNGRFEYSNIVNVKASGLNTYKLDQNYPNPFNPSTKIQYAIGSRQYVSLKIYDMLGREVATLVNETKDPGNYTVLFNAGMLTSGIYIYKMRAGSFVESRKLILLK